MGEVVTSLTIDADTSGADKFAQAMASAEQAAGGGVSAAMGFNTSLIAIGGGAAAAVLGIKSMLDYVAEANKGLADMQTVAHQVGLTLTDFQGIQFGGAIKGLSTDQINTGLEKSAQLLNDASRNSNSLSKELDANGISVKNANGQLISENQLLGIAANLVKNAANPGDQLVIAQMLGFTKEWVPLLQQGAGAMAGLASEAKAAGAVIERHTEAQIADAKAVGLGDAALAGFKADAAESAAVLANHNKETDKQVDDFGDLRDAAVAAADGLAKAKAASQIEFGSKTAFLSADDVAIANQLKGIYGNDIPTALNSTYAVSLRVNGSLKPVKKPAAEKEREADREFDHRSKAA
jgi:hypothetical protein